MKLTINKDNKCIKCKVAICCDGGVSTQSPHHFCWSCGEPIEWIKDRTAEEIVDELKIFSCRVGEARALARFDDEKELIKKTSSLTIELLNKINKYD